MSDDVLVPGPDHTSADGPFICPIQPTPFLCLTDRFLHQSSRMLPLYGLPLQRNIPWGISAWLGLFHIKCHLPCLALPMAIISSSQQIASQISTSQRSHKASSIPTLPFNTIVNHIQLSFPLNPSKSYLSPSLPLVTWWNLYVLFNLLTHTIKLRPCTHKYMQL